jgi:hypothetical protein
VTPAVFARLSDGAQLLIWGVRHWMVAMLQGRTVPVSVARSFDEPGGSNAYASLTAFVLLAARDADRPLAINPPCCQELSADEENLTRVVTALTNDAPSAALGRLRSLTGGEPSAALQRHAQLVADRFAAVGLSVGIDETPFPIRAFR